MPNDGTEWMSTPLIPISPPYNHSDIVSHSSWLNESLSLVGIFGMVVTVVGLYVLSQESARTAAQRQTPVDGMKSSESSTVAVQVAAATHRVTYGMAMSLISSVAYGAVLTLRKVG